MKLRAFLFFLALSGAGGGLLLPQESGAYPWLDLERLDLERPGRPGGPAASGPPPAGLAMPRARRQSAKAGLELDFHGSYFFKKKSFPLFAGISLRRKSRKTALDLSWQRSFIEKRSYFRFGELNAVFPLFSGQLDDRLKLALGFSRRKWSEADEYWNLGLWLPRYKIDPFRPKTAGLPGAYLDFLDSSGSVSFTALLSYFYLPDVIILPQLFNGAVGSKNPFFSSSLVKSLSDVSWRIEKKPKIQLARLLKPLAAFQIRHKAADSRLSLSYAFKPVNQLQYAIRYGGIDLSSSSLQKLTVKEIDYAAVSHHLLAVEGKWSLNSDISLTGSLLHERPGKYKKTDKAPAGGGWLTDDFEAHWTASLFGRMRGAFAKNEKAFFSFGYIKVFEEKEGLGKAAGKRSSNAIIEDLEPFFGRAFEWRHALSLSMEYGREYAPGRPLKGFDFRLRLNHALDNQFYAAIFEQRWHLAPSWSFYLSGDVLFRLSGSSAIKSGSSAISKYKSLSRLLAGGSYAF